MSRPPTRPHSTQHGQPLTPVEPQVSYTHDRDFGRYKVWPTGKKERFMGRGWCPPRGKEYETWPIFKLQKLQLQKYDFLAYFFVVEISNCRTHYVSISSILIVE